MCASATEGWPPPRPMPQGRLAVAIAVVLGASGSVITDALGLMRFSPALPSSTDAIATEEKS